MSTFDGTTAALPAFGEPTFESIAKILAEVGERARLLKITVRPGELSALLKQFGALLDGVPVAESRILSGRWIAEWTDSFWLCSNDGTIRKVVRIAADAIPFLGDAPPARLGFVPARLGFIFPAPSLASIIADIGTAPSAAVRRRRASKGWRRHVRRTKAAKRRAAWMRGAS